MTIRMIDLGDLNSDLLKGIKKAILEQQAKEATPEAVYRAEMLIADVFEKNNVGKITGLAALISLYCSVGDAIGLTREQIHGSVDKWIDGKKRDKENGAKP